MSQPKNLDTLLTEIRRLTLLTQIQRLTNRSDMPRRIELCQTALKLVVRDNQPEQWASLENQLGYSLMQNPLGDRANNLEQAINHFQQSLEVYRYEAYPEKWAMSMNNLATAYLYRIRGERAENLEQAIDYLRLSLKVRTYQAFPEKWAMSINNLALTYSIRIKGERRQNLEQAISLYKQAQKVWRHKAFPFEWATSCNNLAEAYKGRIKGQRAENLERAISFYQQAQKVYTHETFPYEWAASCNNLAETYEKRIRGQHAENLERAISLYEQSLEVYRHQVFPLEWARSINNLAVAYSSRIRGQRAENLEQAISLYKQAQKVLTPQAFPEKWATSMNNLAETYRRRIKGERSENLERAIFFEEQAQKVLTLQTFPGKWATSIAGLATAHLYRIRGKPAENLERAISLYKQSLEVYTRQAFPFEWATICNNLALALYKRIKGKPAENLERSISLYKQVQQVWMRRAFPEKWATSMNNLAEAYFHRIKGERAENLEQAISHYKQAQKVWTGHAFPQKWALNCNNLAAAYSERIKGKRTKNLERAIDYLKQALEVYMPQSFPQDSRNTAYLLGDLLYNENRFGEAREALVTAHEAVEVLRGEVLREGGRRELAAENADMYARLVFCCLHDALTPSPSPNNRRGEHIEAAFEYAVAGKGRVFADLLASTRFDLSAVGGDDPVFAADWQTHREFCQQLDNLLVQLTGNKGIIGGSGGQTGSGSRENERLPKKVLHDELRATQKKAATHWEEMTFRYPALTACESAPTLTAQDARELSAQLGATLVEYYQHAEGWCAFVVTPDEVRYVALPAVDKLIALMQKWTNRIKKAKNRNPASYRRLLKWYEAVIAPLNLPKGQAKVVLAPFGALHVLPLAAARHPKSQRYVSQEHTLAFAPSLGALSVAVKESRKGQSRPASWKQALLVAYPGEPPLDHVLPEAQAIANYFPEPTPLHKEAATPDEVVKEARGKEVIHFGCHGWFDSQQPEQSGLMLADGWLTVQRIISDLRLKTCQLTTLGACQSGRTALGSGDEHVGLIQALMTAGTPSVVASLWNVNDIATRALFEHFYGEIKKGQPPAIALRQAAEEVRQCAGWEHPYFWSAFAVSGLAHGPIRPALFDVIEETTLPLAGKLLDMIQQKSQSVRGSRNMNEKEIYNEAIELLEQISEDADYFAEEIGPTDGAIAINQLAALCQQAALVESESQLLTLCDAIHKFIEEMPILRYLLISEYSDVSQMQKERAIYLEDIEYAATQQQRDKKALDTIRQHLVETRQKLEHHLSKLEQQQSQPPSRRES